MTSTKCLSHQWAVQFCYTTNQTPEKHGMTIPWMDTTLRYQENIIDATKSESNVPQTPIHNSTNYNKGRCSCDSINTTCHGATECNTNKHWRTGRGIANMVNNHLPHSSQKDTSTTGTEKLCINSNHHHVQLRVEETQPDQSNKSMLDLGNK